MTTPPELLAAPEPRDRVLGTLASPVPGVRADERGAILVMGIFMCACMVGILWYLAGIGDAIVYRQRMQEAADATAFSAAVLHARGMNFLVMLNLIMACVLAVRVALKVAYVVLNVLSIALAWIPGVGATLQGLARAANSARSAADPGIDAALQGLTAAERIIPRIVPPAAIIGSIQVGMKYRPLVENAAAGNPVTTLEGLPVEDGSTDVLCYQAGKAVIDIIFGYIPGVRGVADYVSGPFGELVASGGDYFCGLGGSSKPPNLDQFVSKQVNKGCRDEENKLKRDLNAAESEHQAACDAYRAPCATFSRAQQVLAKLTEAQQKDLDEKELKVQAAQAELDRFNGDQCRSEGKKKAKAQISDATSSSSNSSGKIFPRRVIQEWMNGVPNAQMLAVATGDTRFLNRAPVGVKAGQWKSSGTITIPASAQFALAQAEYFYDCSGAWESNDCNGNGKGVRQSELAMWNFRWRARLRRYNAPFEGVVPGVEQVAETLNMAVLAERVSRTNFLKSATLQNAEQLAELSEILLTTDPQSLIIH